MQKLFVAIPVAFTLFVAAIAGAPDKIVFSEIMYHPVERPAFDTNGAPLLDLSDDVHEFVELHNAGTNAASLDGWRLLGGVAFKFPAGITVLPGGFVVIAKNPTRLAAIPQYGLTTNQILGPYSGHLRNSGNTIRLQNAVDEVVDSISYSSSFPWAISANALGAEDEWTGLNSYDHQYRGRSLERLSFDHSANDPANWLASPLPSGPTPRRTNSVQLSAPRPVVVAFSATETNGAAIIRANQPARLEVTFSATNQLGNVSAEFFVDDVNLTNEPRATLALAPLNTPSDGRYVTTLPGRISRTVVRYRIRADRGAGVETVSPRADDPFAWHAYFVTPTRASANPIYDVLISSASLTALSTNISQSPRRIRNPDPPGTPRESWNATQPAILIYNGEVFDIQMRHHGSRYNRGAGRNSFKWQFPRYHRFYGGRESVFITDKGDQHRIGALLYDAADFLAWRCRYIDLYLNGNSLLVRLEQEEVDETLYRRWAEEQTARYPGRALENLGGVFKATGVIPFETGAGQGVATYFNSGEGPYFIGNCTVPPAKPGWSVRQRCEWTYGPQINGWKGGGDVEELLTGLWAARGDSPIAPSPNVAAVRSFLQSNFDVERTLTYIAIRDWSGPFDNATHNHFLWRYADGRWSMLPWDLDSEFDNPPQTIFWDEHVNAQPDPLRGPHWIKDSFYKAFRNEYKQRLWLLNNTLLHPTNFVLNGWTPLKAFADQRVISVNAQLGLGVFHRPTTPTNMAPANGSAVFPSAALVASPYGHTDTNRPAHASTTWLVRRANGGYTNPVLRVTSTTNLTSLPIPFDALVFGQAYFWKCSYTDTNGHPSWASTETSFVFGGGAASGAVMLNEILADNRGSVTNGPDASSGFPDFIELINTSSQTRDLSAFSLTDNALQPGKFFFPPGTIIGPNGFLVLWCDDATNAPGLHTGFALDNDGQTVALFAITTNGYALADSVRFGLQVEDRSIGRVGSNWLLSVPTPDASNTAAAVGPATSLKVNEWLASASGGPDWFELFNPEPLPVALGGLYLSDTLANVTNTRVAALSFIGARGFRQFIADEDETRSARHVDFRLSANGESILLTGTNLVRIDAVSFGAQATDVSQGRLLDGSTNIVSFPDSASPEAPNFLPLTGVVINEVLSHSDPPLEDAIELHNVSGPSVDVGGWWLSDSLDDLQKFRIPTNTMLVAGGFAVFGGSQFGSGNLPAAFALSGAHGDEVYLSATDGAGNLTGRRANVRFGAAESGVSFGRVTTSVGVDFWAQTARTFSNANAGPLVGPVVISEIQYHPPSVPGDDDDYEYIKLHNITATNVPLFDPARPANTWRLRDAVDLDFPTNVILPPNGSVFVVGFDPALNTAMLTDFRSLYGLDESAIILGPYQGRLDNAGDSVELLKPDSPVALPGPDFGFVPHVLGDRVRYSDAAPWPATADGTGNSLRRVNLAGYGNEPTNWIAAPALVNNARPTIAVIMPTNGASFGLGVPVSITVNANDSDGVVRRVEFFVDGGRIGQSTNAAFSFTWSNAPLGSHELFARAIDDRLGVTDSPPVFISIVNFAPTVALISPTNGASFLLPTNIVLEATASDGDGTVTRVDFYASGLYLGTVTTPPYRLTWTNVPAGIYQLVANAVDNLGAVNGSPPVTIRAAREIPIAYVVNAGTVGLQSVGTGLGMDFDVVTNIVVTHLGAFDSGSDGINGATTLTTQLYTRSGNSGTVLATMTFSAAAPGTLVNGSRFKPLAAPVTLSPGAYSIVSYGHDGANPNGNIDRQAKTWSTDNGGGYLAFVGSSRYGSGGGPGTFPATPDGGPVDRYAAATFQFRSVPDAPLIPVRFPDEFFLRAGASTNLASGAIGRAPLRYQWTLNGTNIPGGTNATLQITNATLVQQGIYQVVVTNLFGVVTNGPASLVLLIEPVITQQPLSQSIIAGSSVTLSISVTNTANVPIGYRLRRNGVILPTNFPGATLVLNERTAFFTISGTNAAPPWTSFGIAVTNVARTNPVFSATAALTYLPDVDGDSMADDWEANYFGSIAESNRDTDSDNDGMLNWQEYVAGTNPTNAASYLKIDALKFGSSATLTFGAISNRTYTIEFTDALGVGGWMKLADVTARATNRVEVITDANSTTNRFYRVTMPRLP